MTKVYITYHLGDDFEYSTSTVSGHLQKINDYVELVDWLMWVSSGKTQHIYIGGGLDGDGKPTKDHLLRARVFAQRMHDLDVDVFVRNETDDEWFVFNGPFLTNEQLLEIECLKSERREVGLMYIKKDVAKFDQYLKEASDTRMAHRWRTRLENEKKRLAVYTQEEERRLNSLANIWKIFN